MDIKTAQQKLFKKRPIFGEFFNAHKEKTWIEYYKQDFENLLKPSEDILNAIEKEAEYIFGKELARKTRENILSKKWIDTADHHGVLCHPYFWSDALARSHKEIIKKDEVVIVFPFGNVSVSNDSFPRGFFFKDENFKTQKIFLKSLKEKQRPVFGLEAFTKKELQIQIEKFSYFKLKKETKEKLLKFLQKIEENKEVWQKKYYSEQITLINNILWKELFGDERGDLVYIELDAIVRRLLLEKHLKKETYIYKIIFDKNWRNSFLNNFDNILGSHKGEKEGTHLFWYIDKTENKRKGLFVKENFLKSQDAKIKIEITPENIIKCIEEKSLMPSSALLLIICHCIEKLACAGGFSQIGYMKDIQNAWLKVLKGFELKEEIPNPSIFSGEYCIESISCGEKKEKASLIDLLIYGDDLNNKIDKDLSETKIEDSINVILPELLKIIEKKYVEIEMDFKIKNIGDVR